MDLFGGGEDLRQRQRQLSVSGQLQQAQQASSSSSGAAAAGAAAPAAARRAGSGRKKGFFGRQARAEGPPRQPQAGAAAPGAPSPRHHATGGLRRLPSAPAGGREAMDVLVSRSSASTAATVRATVHQLAETLTAFGACRWTGHGRGRDGGAAARVGQPGAVVRR